MSLEFFRELSLMYWWFGHSLDSSDPISEKGFRGPCIAPSETFSPTMIRPDVSLQQDEHTSKNYLNAKDDILKPCDTSWQLMIIII